MTPPLHTVFTGIHVVTVDANIVDADGIEWLTSSTEQLTVRAIDETQQARSTGSAGRPNPAQQEQQQEQEQQQQQQQAQQQQQH